MLHRLSLRARLLLGVALLAAVGLLAADVATYASLRSFLLDRVDTTLEGGHVAVERSTLGSDDRGGGSGGGRRLGAPAQGIDWYQVRTLAGTRLRGGFLVGSGSPPDVDNPIAVPTRRASGADPERVSYFTVSSADGSKTYRVRASIDPEHPRQVLLVAASLGDVHGTLRRLLVVELLVALAVLAAIAGLGLWVVRLGLRPLRTIEATAATIAAGDLSQRVERSEPTTEVGRLGASLNVMLTQIEAAFTARQESEERLRRFVADASHELRTPLAAVRAYAELFGRGAADRPADLARSMRGITREAERMSLLVDDLLLLARLDEGRPFEQSPVDLAQVVREAADAALVLDAERPVELALEAATVLGDHDRLRQAVDNLFANVRAHTPAGTCVRVVLRRVGDRAVLEVRDTGPGFSDEDAAHVFERFYRTDRSRTRASGGVGLGLSIVAAIVHAHGGTAQAGGGAGAGASIVLSLPLLDVQA